VGPGWNTPAVSYLPASPRPARLLQEWLSDKRGRDQFVARYGDETEVCWNDAPKQQEETVYKRSFWTGGWARMMHYNGEIGAWICAPHVATAASSGGAVTDTPTAHVSTPAAAATPALPLSLPLQNLTWSGPPAVA
jgi:hypothetical protein